jgi:hypothetical protein
MITMDEQWTVIGKDLENPEDPKRKLVKVLLAQTTLDGKTVKHPVCMFKDIYEGIRNEIYDLVFTIHLNGKMDFKVFYGDREIAYNPRSFAMLLENYRTKKDERNTGIDDNDQKENPKGEMNGSV